MVLAPIEFWPVKNRNPRGIRGFGLADRSHLHRDPNQLLIVVLGIAQFGWPVEARYVSECSSL